MKVSDEMKKQKKYYSEIYFQEELFCQLQGCEACKGYDPTGEPNGYGCDASTEWIGDDEHEEINIEEKHGFIKETDFDLIILKVEALEKALEDVLESGCCVHHKRCQIDAISKKCLLNVSYKDCATIKAKELL